MSLKELNELNKEIDTLKYKIRTLVGIQDRMEQKRIDEILAGERNPRKLNWIDSGEKEVLDAIDEMRLELKKLKEKRLSLKIEMTLFKLARIKLIRTGIKWIANNR